MIHATQAVRAGAPVHCLPGSGCQYFTAMLHVLENALCGEALQMQSLAGTAEFRLVCRCQPCADSAYGPGAAWDVSADGLHVMVVLLAQEELVPTARELGIGFLGESQPDPKRGTVYQGQDCCLYPAPTVCGCLPSNSATQGML